MNEILAGLKAVPSSRDVTERLEPSAGNSPFEGGLRALLWKDAAGAGPFAPDGSADVESQETVVWMRYLVLLTRLNGLAVGQLGSWFDEPRRALGGATMSEACRSLEGFTRGLGLAHVSGGGDPAVGSLDDRLLSDLEELLGTHAKPATAPDLLCRHLKALAEAFGGRPQALVIYACHRWGFEDGPFAARGTTLFRLYKTGQLELVDTIIKGFAR